jgi:hypothetical protein
MRRGLMILTAIALFACLGQVFSADDKGGGLNEEGFVTTWLLLAPIPLGENANGAEALGKEQVEGEANLKPKAGDKQKAGDKELEWKEYKVKDYFFDFNDLLGKQTEDSAGYAVCYIIAPSDMDAIKLKTGSDDQAKVYLNGKEVLKQDQARPIDKDQDASDVTLKKGTNVLVFKVVNEKVDWAGCARFTDKEGNPVKGLKASTSPK